MREGGREGGMEGVIHNDYPRANTIIFKSISQFAWK